MQIIHMYDIFYRSTCNVITLRIITTAATGALHIYIYISPSTGTQNSQTHETHPLTKRDLILHLPLIFRFVTFSQIGIEIWVGWVPYKYNIFYTIVFYNEYPSLVFFFSLLFLAFQHGKLLSSKENVQVQLSLWSTFKSSTINSTCWAA